MTISFNVGMLPNRHINDCIEQGIASEKLGYDGVWVADSHSIFRDAYALLNVLAVKTDKLKLATGVTLTGTRHPAVLANSWATLHELSGGREILVVAQFEISPFFFFLYGLRVLGACIGAKAAISSSVQT